MSVRKKYCFGDCDFNHHFSQSGRGVGEVFRGAPYQRGHGLGTIFRRFGIPLFKFFGKHLLRTGMDLGSDALENNLNRDTLKKRVKEGALRLGEESINKASNFITGQRGSGRKRKRQLTTKRLHKKKRKVTRNDIFG